MRRRTHVGRAERDGWGIVLDDAKEGLHRLESVIRRLALEKFDHYASNAPERRKDKLVRSEEREETRTDQMSEDVLAPACSMISGATREHARLSSLYQSAYDDSAYSSTASRRRPSQRRSCAPRHRSRRA